MPAIIRDHLSAVKRFALNLALVLSVISIFNWNFKVLIVLRVSNKDLLRRKLEYGEINNLLGTSSSILKIEISRIDFVAIANTNRADRDKDSLLSLQVKIILLMKNIYPLC